MRLQLYNYLSQRFQSVCVDGCLSPPLGLECGVPQGSILGPLLFILFTNDIPYLVHDHPVCLEDPSPGCQQCGSTVCYVDDCTYSHGDTDPLALSETLSDQYNRISSYMAANRLVINAEKTHLLVMGTRASATRRHEVHLQADQHKILPTQSEKLLGGLISQDLKWTNHLQGSDQSVVKQLTSRLNGLVKGAARASFSTRKMVANGIFISKLCYLIQLWGGAEGYLLQALQVLQNKAARAVTHQSWFTPTRILLARCNWLSVQQLVFCQTVLTIHKIVISGRPYYLHKKMISQYPYKTRQAVGGGVRFGENFTGTSGLIHDSFCYRGAVDYNRVPSFIRSARSLNTFKYKLKQWVSTNIPLG